MMLGWMPTAAVYFRDPDGHLLEYITMLEEEPQLAVGIVPWSVWLSRHHLAPAEVDHGAR